MRCSHSTFPVTAEGRWGGPFTDMAFFLDTSVSDFFVAHQAGPKVSGENLSGVVGSSPSPKLGVAQASLVAQTVTNPPAMQEIWFNPWVGKIPWRARQPPPVFLPRESPWTDSPWGHRVGHGRATEYTHL